MAVAQSTGLEVIDERDSEALTTPMTVMDDAGMVWDADGMYEVTTDSGSEYIVDRDDVVGKGRHRGVDLLASEMPARRCIVALQL
ncbi:hypothetical protein [Halostagnicola kamekurae]|uniref:Uncharacterized protein n=1 Tax=Halostagnicola kamekurae TaxID=619731 RepID=A0A1I6UZ55_9EURY|nr:hypothetical protein SAMN04488556_4192 [Halostagnicola kamekurae]